MKDCSKSETTYTILTTPSFNFSDISCDKFNDTRQKKRQKVPGCFQFKNLFSTYVAVKRVTVKGRWESSLPHFHPVGGG